MQLTAHANHTSVQILTITILTFDAYYRTVQLDILVCTNLFVYAVLLTQGSPAQHQATFSKK